MTVDEVRDIREKTSLETINMTVDELRLYFAHGATDIESRIVKIRKIKGIILDSTCDSVINKAKHKNEHAYIRGAEYYANSSNTNVNVNTEQGVSVHEPTENSSGND